MNIEHLIISDGFDAMQTPKKTIVLRWPRHAPQQSQLHFFAPQPQPQLPLAHGLAPHPDHQQRRQLQQWEFLQHQSRCCPVKTWIQVSETALTKTTSGHQHQHQHTHTQLFLVTCHLVTSLVSTYSMDGWPQHSPQQSQLPSLAPQPHPQEQEPRELLEHQSRCS